MRVARATPTAAEPEAACPLERAVDAIILVPVVVVGAEPGVQQRQEAVIGSVRVRGVEVESVARRLVRDLEILVDLNVRGAVGYFDGDAQFVRPD